MIKTAVDLILALESRPRSVVVERRAAWRPGVGTSWAWLPNGGSRAKAAWEVGDDAVEAAVQRGWIDDVSVCGKPPCFKLTSVGELKAIEFKEAADAA
ncbi:MAG: hypothetical protein AAGE65_03585 [Planctomycetota bacterium]